MRQTKWFQSKEFYIAYSIMINAAQHQGLATYQEIAQAIGLPTVGNLMGKEIGDLIGIISENEVNLNRPMLSALVVGKNGNTGGGFIPLAKELGLFKEGEDEQKFLEDELEKIYKEWKIIYKISNK